MAERLPYVDLRLIRSFVVLADRRHFGRAAARLHVSVSALSQQIRRLELDLGSQLFARSTRSVELTPEGEMLRPIAAELLAAEARFLRSAGHIRRSTMHVLRLGYLSGSNNVVPALAEVLAEQNPAVVVQTRRLDWADQVEAVRDGRVDASFVRPPLDFTDLEVVPVWTEHRVVILPVGHRLAGEPELSLQDVADEPIVMSTSAPREWGRWWTVDPRPDGRRPRYGPDVHTVDDMLEVVALGRCCGITAASVARYYQRPDVMYIPLRGVEPTTVVLCWAVGDQRPHVRALRAALEQLRRAGRLDDIARSGPASADPGSPLSEEGAQPKGRLVGALDPRHRV